MGEDEERGNVELYIHLFILSCAHVLTDDFLPVVQEVHGLQPL